MFGGRRVRAPDSNWPPPLEPIDWLELVRPAGLFDFVVMAAVAGLFLLVILRFTTVVAIETEPKPVASPTPIPTVAPPAVYHRGDRFAVGSLDLRVTGVDRQRELELPEIGGRLPARNEWVVVEVSLRARGSEPVSWQAEDFVLRSPSGEVYVVDQGATELMNQALARQGYRGAGEPLPAAESVSVRLLFDVPEVSRDLRLIIWPGAIVDLSG